MKQIKQVITRQTFWILLMLYCLRPQAILDASKPSLMVQSRELSNSFQSGQLGREAHHFGTTTEESLVPIQEQINDFETRHLLAQIEAFYKKKYLKAIKEYQRLLQEQPNNIDLLIELARIEGTIGHAKKAKELYMHILEISHNADSVLLEYGDMMNMWGDFYHAEEIYKEFLKKEPDSLSLQIKLAHLFEASQRYEEAEQIYQELLLNFPQSAETILLQLTTLKILEKDFEHALNFSDRLLSYTPKKSEYLLLRADILFQKRCFVEALQIYQELKDDKKFRLKATINIGKIYRQLYCPGLQTPQFVTAGGIKEHNMAMLAFEEAYREDCENAESQYYYAKFVDPMLMETVSDPQILNQWASFAAQDGLNSQALKFYEKALSLDPDNFPAQIGRAEMLAIKRNYDTAFIIYTALLEEFPQNSKIMLAEARVQSWSKNYDKGIALYDTIIALNPKDPVPRKEKARTAFWATDQKTAIKTYESMFTISVDELLLSDLLSLKNEILDPSLLYTIEILAISVCNGSIYQGYETFVENFNVWEQTLDENKSQVDGVEYKIKKIIIKHLAQFLIQKSFCLESEAKDLVWNKYPHTALGVYHKLIHFAPGNEEALFDEAQLYSSLGCHDLAIKNYRTILNIDPLHTIVQTALNREEMKENLLIYSNASYWKEKGIGQFSTSSIMRRRVNVCIQHPITSRCYIRLADNHWLEKPDLNKQVYIANGYTAAIDAVFNCRTKGRASFTQKFYANHEFKTRLSGLAALSFDTTDRLHLGFGYERTDEIYNFFNLKQGTQADNWQLSAETNITRKLIVKGTAWYIQYNDNNGLNFYEIYTSYAFTEYPNVFKLNLQGEYRNIAHENMTLTSGTTVTDIIFPYWTPKHYYAGSATLEWFYDYAPIQFSGCEPRHFDLQFSYRNSTYNNPAYRAEGKWTHGFKNHWSFDLSGVYEYSKLWKGQGLWATLTYQF